MTRYTEDSVTAAIIIFEDCRKRGQSIEESFRRSIGGLIQAVGPGVEAAVAAGDFASAYGLQIDHEMAAADEQSLYVHGKPPAQRLAEVCACYPECRNDCPEWQKCVERMPEYADRCFGPDRAKWPANVLAAWEKRFSGRDISTRIPSP